MIIDFSDDVTFPKVDMRVPVNGESAEAFWMNALNFEAPSYNFVASLPARQVEPQQVAVAPVLPVVEEIKIEPHYTEEKTSPYVPTAAERELFILHVDDYMSRKSWSYEGQLGCLRQLLRNVGYYWQEKYLKWRLSKVRQNKRMKTNQDARRRKERKENWERWISVIQPKSYRRRHRFGQINHTWFSELIREFNDCFWYLEGIEADETWDEEPDLDYLDSEIIPPYVPRRLRPKAPLYGPYWPPQSEVVKERDATLLAKLRAAILVKRSIRLGKLQAHPKPQPAPQASKVEKQAAASLKQQVKLATSWLDTAAAALLCMKDHTYFNRDFVVQYNTVTHEMQDGAEGAEGELNVTQSSNVVITEQHGASAASETPTGPAARLVSSDIIRSYEELVNRELVFKTVTWESQEVGAELLSADLPRDFVLAIDGTPNSVPFDFNRYMRGDMQIRIQVNTNPFMIGSLQLAWYYQMRSDKYASYRQNIASNSQTLHALVNASTSNEAILVIPYKNFKPLIEIGQRKDKDISLYLGRLSLTVLNKLQCTSNVDKSASVTLFVSFINTEFTGYINRSLNTINHEMMPVAAIAAMSLAEKMIDANRDKPTTSAHPQYFSPQLAQSWCHGTGKDESTFDLRLMRADVPHPVRYTDAPFNQADIVQRYGYCGTRVWKTSLPSGSLLTSFEAAPMVDESFYHHIITAQNKRDAYVLPPVAFVANLYQYWRGSLKLRLDFIATRFHCGRLLLAYIPGDFKREATLEQAKASTYVIFDLKETQQCNFMIPFIADKVYWPRRMQVDYNGFDAYSPGYVYVFVLNKLVAMDSVPNEVPFNIYMAGSDDMEFIIPAQPTLGLAWNDNWLTPSGKGAAITNATSWYVGTYTDLDLNFPSIDFYAAILRYGTLYGHIAQLWMADTYNYASGYFYYLKPKDWKFSVRSTPSGKPDTNVDALIPWYDGTFIYAIPVTSVANAEWWCQQMIRYKGKYIDFLTEDVAKRLFYNYPKGDDADPYYTNLDFAIVKVKQSSKVQDFVIVDHEMDPRVDQSTPTLAGTSAALTTNYGRSQLGETFGDFKDICRRYQPYGTVYIPDTAKIDPHPGRVLFEFPVLPQGLDLSIGDNSKPLNFWNKLREGMIPLLLSGFRFFRGSIRFRISLPDFPGTYFVQHIPFTNTSARTIIIHDKEINSATDTFNHGYAYTVQSQSINKVLSFEVPYYLNVDSMLLQSSFVDSKNVNTDIAYACTIGMVRVGIAHSDVSLKGKALHFEIVYSLGDDARPSVFQGFPPVILTQQIPSNIVHADHEMFKFGKEIKDDVEKARELFNEVKKIDLQNIETKSVEALESFTMSSSAISELCDRVKGMTNKASEGFETFLNELKKGAAPTILVTALSHILQVLYNPSPVVMGIAISSFLMTLGVVAYDKCKHVIDLVSRIMSTFSKEQPKEGTPVQADAEMDSGDATALVSVLFAGMSTVVNSTAKLKGPYAKSLSEGLLVGLSSGCKDGSYFFRFLSNIMGTLVKLYDYLVKKLFPTKLGLENMILDSQIIEKWACECAFLTLPENEELFDMCPAFVNRVHSCYILGTIFMVRIAGAPKSVNVTAFKELYNKIIKLRTTLYDRGNGGIIRREPFILWMGGAPGIGKSHVSTSVVMHLLRAAGIPVTGNPIYTHPAGAKYWENCNQEPVILMDDAFVTRSGELNEAEIATFMSLKSPALFTPPMAECDRKKKRIAPEIVYVNSNNDFPELTNMETKEAIYRRRDTMWTAFIAPQFAHIPIKEIPVEILQNYQHLLFSRRINPRDPQSGFDRVPYTYPQFLYYVTQDFLRFRNSQILSYTNKMEEFNGQLAGITDNPILLENPLADVIKTYAEQEKFADLKQFLPEAKTLIQEVAAGARHVMGVHNHVAKHEMFEFLSATNKIDKIIGKGKSNFFLTGLLYHVAEIAPALVKGIAERWGEESTTKLGTLAVLPHLVTLNNELPYSFATHILLFGSPEAKAALTTLLESCPKWDIAKKNLDHFAPRLINDKTYFLEIFYRFLRTNKGYGWDGDVTVLESVMFGNVFFPVKDELAQKILFMNNTLPVIKECEPSTSEDQHRANLLKSCEEFISAPDNETTTNWKEADLRKHFADNAPTHICCHHANVAFRELKVEECVDGMLALNIKPLHDVKTKEDLKTVLNHLIEKKKLCRHFFAFIRPIGSLMCTCIDRTDASHTLHFCRRAFDNSSQCSKTCIMNNEPLLDERCAENCICTSPSLFKAARTLFIKHNQGIILSSIEDGTLMPKIFKVGICKHIITDLLSRIKSGILSLKQWIWDKMQKMGGYAMKAFEFIKRNKWLFLGIFSIVGGIGAFVFRKELRDAVDNVGTRGRGLVADLHMEGSKKCLSIKDWLARKTSRRVLEGSLNGSPVDTPDGELSVVDALNHEMFGSGDARNTNAASRAMMKARFVSNLSKFKSLATHESGDQEDVIMTKLLNNTVMVTGLTTPPCGKFPENADVITGVVRTLFVGSRFAVTVTHALEVFNSRETKTLGFFIKDRYFDCDINSVIWDPLQEPSSLCILKFPANIPEFKNIVNWIASEADHAVRAPSFASIVKIDSKFSEAFVPVTFVAEDIQIGNLPGAETIINNQLYSYPAHGQGVCGSLLICLDRATPIFGMHVAGTKNTGMGYSEPLFRETFAQLFKNLRVPRNAADDLCDILADADKASIDIPTSILPVGKVPRKLMHANAEVSCIVPSLIHGFVEPTTAPAPLTPKDPRVDGSPLVAGVSKHGEVTRNFPVEVLDRTTERLRTHILANCRPVRSVLEPTLTDQQAVCGDPDLPFCDALNWNSSEGYPYFKFRPAGVTNKKWLFSLSECDGQMKLDGFHPMLAENLKLKRELRAKNTKYPTFFTDCLKDARIAVEKVPIPGKTRIFSMSPIDYTIDFRKFLYDFIASYQTQRFQNYNAIGINVFSEEWNVLAQSLLKFRNICTGDYSNFGPGLNEEVANRCIEIIMAWYDYNWPNDTEENANTRRCLLGELIGALHQCKDLIYSVVAGIPSGSPITVVLNSLVNTFYLFAAWDILSEEWPLSFQNFQNFSTDIVLYTYGDDFIMSVSEKYKDLFNTLTIQKCFKEYNIKLTAADKSTGEPAPYLSLPESTFLKGNFMYFDNKYWYALQKSQIYDMCNWVRKCPDEKQALLDNMDAALIHAQGWGPTFFQEFRTQITNAAIAKQIAFQGRTYNQIYRIKQKMTDPDMAYSKLVRSIVALV